MQAAGKALDDFLLEYLHEGLELAGEYPQRIADERAAQAAYRAEQDRPVGQFGKKKFQKSCLIPIFNEKKNFQTNFESFRSVK